MKTAKLFKNGQSQAVRLPREFRLQGEEVYVRKIGNALILIPKKDSWQNLIDSLTEFSADFMEERIQPQQQIRKESFD